MTQKTNNNIAKNYTILNNGKLVIETWAGKIPHDAVITQHKIKLCDRHIASNTVILGDLRYSVMPETSTDNIPDIVETYKNPNNTVSVSKIILIVPEPELFEKVTHFRALMENIGIEVIMTSSISSACLLTGVKEKELEEIINTLDINYSI